MNKLIKKSIIISIIIIYLMLSITLLIENRNTYSPDERTYLSFYDLDESGKIELTIESELNEKYDTELFTPEEWASTKEGENNKITPNRFFGFILFLKVYDSLYNYYPLFIIPIFFLFIIIFNYIILKKFIGKNSSIIFSAILFTTPLFFMYSLLIRNDLFAIAFFISSILISLISVSYKKGNLLIFSGICFGFSFFIRPTYIYFLPFILAANFFLFNKNIKKLLKFFIGFLLVFILFMAFNYGINDSLIDSRYTTQESFMENLEELSPIEQVFLKYIRLRPIRALENSTETINLVTFGMPFLLILPLILIYSLNNKKYKKNKKNIKRFLIFLGLGALYLTVFNYSLPSVGFGSSVDYKTTISSLNRYFFPVFWVLFIFASLNYKYLKGSINKKLQIFLIFIFIMINILVIFTQPYHYNLQGIYDEKINFAEKIEGYVENNLENNSIIITNHFQKYLDKNKKILSLHSYDSQNNEKIINLILKIEEPLYFFRFGDKENLFFEDIGKEKKLSLEKIDIIYIELNRAELNNKKLNIGVYKIIKNENIDNK